MRCLLFMLFLSVCSFGTACDAVWGKTGHQITAHIAQQHLNEQAKTAIAELLEGENMAAVSNYADDIKKIQAFKKYSPWHYVNFPFDERYGDSPVSEKGDLVMGIETCIALLKDSSTERSERIFYLKLLIHFMGDLHQPLHVGRASDRGGNDIQVRWYDQGSNLHRVWDIDIIDHFGMNYSEWSESLPKPNAQLKAKILEGNVIDWVHESQELSKMVYASATIGEKLEAEYLNTHIKIVREQLVKGGLRLAKVLNAIFS